MSDVIGKTAAVILAGGQGSRLHELTADICKPAVPFANGRLIVDWTLANLARVSPARTIVATQYKPAALAGHIERKWRAGFPANSLSIRDGSQVRPKGRGYVGTADAVTQNLGDVMQDGPDAVLVLAADHIYKMDYAAMIDAHRASRRPVTVAVDRVSLDDATAFGVMDVDATSNVTDFTEKPDCPKAMRADPKRALVSMGVYVFDAQWLRDRLAADSRDERSSHDFGHDILPAAVRRGEVQAYDVAAHESDFFWRDVGTLDALRQTCVDIMTGAAPCACPSYPVQARHGGTRLLPGDTVVLPGASVAAGARLRRAIVAPDAQVPSDLVVGFDRNEDARHFRVSPGGTVLITEPMLAEWRRDRSPNAGVSMVQSVPQSARF